jgi:hypothetical protein
MPVSICPRCKHINPEYAAYCHFDGVVLQAHQNATAHRLPHNFVFPSGRRCITFDDLAQGCQEEWPAARDLLLRGVFSEFFGNCQRDDLVRAANDARANLNPDIALTTFLESLPGTRTRTPKLDLNPRRILVGTLLVGETKSITLTITNVGQSMLQGTVTVSEGQDWLSLSDTKKLHEVEVAAVREQVIKLTINTRGIAAAQTYGAKLTVVTNGGVVEVPVRMDIAAQPFPRAPFQGVRTQRELAEKMRQHPKATVPILESGDVERWYALNGWTYPVNGAQIKGVGGVQQFFEGMGVSKAPPVSLSQQEFRFKCKFRETTRGQVTLQTSAKKWVYATIKSDTPWLKTPEIQVAGPQHVTVPFEVDTKAWIAGSVGEGKLTLNANGGQKLTLRVIVEVEGAPAQEKPKTSAPRPAPQPIEQTPSTPAPRPTRAAGGVKFIPALITTLVLCLLLRVLLIPFVDFLARPMVARAAAHKLGVEAAHGSPINEIGGWLKLPWLPILAGVDTKISAQDFQPDAKTELRAQDFRHYFVSYFMRDFVLATFWIGAIIGAVLVLRRGGGVLDIPWGIIAGLVAGFGFSATLAACFLVGEMLPHALWYVVFGSHGGIGFLVLWIILAIICWFIVGIIAGLFLPWIGPVRRALIDPFQSMTAGVFRVVGMRSLADYWSP